MSISRAKGLKELSLTSQVLKHRDLHILQFSFCWNPQPQAWTKLLKAILLSVFIPRLIRDSTPQLVLLMISEMPVCWFSFTQISVLHATIDWVTWNLFRTPCRWSSFPSSGTDSATVLQRKALTFYVMTAVWYWALRLCFPFISTSSWAANLSTGL